MYPTGSHQHVSGVEDDVPDLPEKDVGAAKLQIPLVCVFIGLYQAQCAWVEVWCALDHRHVRRVADNLGVVVVYDGARNLVGAGREVHDGWCNGCSYAGGVTAAAVAITDGGVDGRRVVGDYRHCLV